MNDFGRTSRRLLGGVVAVVLGTVCSHAEMERQPDQPFATFAVTGILELHSREPNPGLGKAHQMQPISKLAGLAQKDLEKELSDSVQRENEMSDALDRCFASSKEDLRLLAVEHERAEKLAIDLADAQQEISTLKALLDEMRSGVAQMSTPKESQFSNTVDAGRTQAGPSEKLANTLPSPNAPVSPPVASKPDLGETKATGPEMELRGDAQQLENKSAVISDVQGRAEGFVAAIVEGFTGPAKPILKQLAMSYADRVDYYGAESPRDVIIAEKRKFAARWPERKYAVRQGSLSSSCDLENAVCSVQGVVDWSTRSKKRGTQSSGAATFTYELKKVDAGFEILGEKGSILSRKLEPLKSNFVETTGSNDYSKGDRDDTNILRKPSKRKAAPRTRSGKMSELYRQREFSYTPSRNLVGRPLGRMPFVGMVPIFWR